MEEVICWHDKKTIIDEMNRNYPVYKNLMNETTHISVFKNHVNRIMNAEVEKQLVMDIGCGTAQISLLFDKQKFEYEGCDLPHILQYCAQHWHPENIYLIFNATLSHYYFLRNYDIIVANAFIDVMEHPLAVLEKILQNAKKIRYFTPARNFTYQANTHTLIKPSYGNFTHHSVINKLDFYQLLKDYNFEVIQQHTCGFGDWENGGHSFLLKKCE